jgi:anti-anti-sigma factor
VIGIDGAEALRDALYPLAAAPSRVVVDLSAAAYIDSAAVDVVDAGAGLIDRAGGTVVVVTRDPRVRTVLTLDGSIAQVSPTLDAALAVPA